MNCNAANSHRISSWGLLLSNHSARDSGMSSIAMALGIVATTAPLTLSVDHQFPPILNETHF